MTTGHHPSVVRPERAARLSPTAPAGSGRQLVVCGMHRSGTSLVTSILKRAGLHVGDRLDAGEVGNPHGHFEDLAFRGFHEDMLAASGHSCFTIDDALRPAMDSPAGLLARRLVEERAHLPLWGWKDPRTCLFLDFWDALLPAASYLFLYRHPVDVALSLCRRNTDREIAEDPSLAFRCWEVYNRLILRFRDRFPERCLLAKVPDLTADIDGFVHRLATKFALPLAAGGVTSLFHPMELAPRAVELGTAWEAVIGDALEIYARLEQSADLPSRPTPKLPAENRPTGEPFAPGRRERDLLAASETLLLTVLESRATGAGPMARMLRCQAIRLRELEALHATLEGNLLEERKRGWQLAEVMAAIERSRAAVRDAHQRVAESTSQLARERARCREIRQDAAAALERATRQRDELEEVLAAIERSRAFAAVRGWWGLRRRLAVWGRGSK